MKHNDFRAFLIGIFGALILGGLVVGAFILGTNNPPPGAKSASGSTVTLQATATPLPATPVPPTPKPGCDVEMIRQAAKGTVRLENREGMGSGFLIGDDMVITNEHVISGYKGVTVQFADGTKGSGTVVAISSEKDIAVVKVTPSKPGLALSWADSTEVKSLQPVVAVGYPLSSTGAPSLTNGTVSRVFTSKSGTSYVQTDAAVNPGNSGGPLLNACGQVVGLITLRARDAEGIGLAQVSGEVKTEAYALMKGDRRQPAQPSVQPSVQSPTSQPAPKSDPAYVAAYLKGVESLMDNSETQFAYVSKKIDEWKIREPLWQNYVSQALDNVKLNDAQVYKVVPPACLTSYHDYLVKGLRELDAGIDALKVAFRYLDLESAKRAKTRMDRGITLLDHADDELSLARC